MRGLRRRVVLSLAAGAAILLCATASTNASAQSGPYKILKTAKVGGDGGFDYVYAQPELRRLFVNRMGNPGHMQVFNLDTLDSVGELANVSGHGSAVDPKSGHGFSTSKPVAMWDAKTLAPIKTIDVQGNPDGILFDSFNDRVYIWSHSAPNATVIDAQDGSVVGTMDLGGAPEQAVSDGKGRIYIDLEDKDKIAVIDVKTLKVAATYDLDGKGGGCAGLAMDVKHNILFASCRKPQAMVVLNALDGKVLDALPIGAGSDGAVFNPATMEAFSSQGDGTLTIVKEKSPTSFAVEQTLATPVRAKTLTLDSKTNHILLITAEFGAPPPPAPGAPAGGRGGRPPMVPGSFAIIEVGK